jgi:thymidylate synthase (FAD)
MTNSLPSQRDPLGDGQSLVRLVDTMGNSLSVINDARQSFDNETSEWTDKESKLLNYLARERHTSPFRGVVFKWQIKCPLFIARQWWKHTVASTYVDDQLGWNEKSFRYCSADDAQFYVPKEFSRQSESNRQASDGTLDSRGQKICHENYARALKASQEAYSYMVLAGASKEQARAILPAALYTSFVWTCSLQALFHFISLRAGKGAQIEITAYAQALFDLGRPVAPEAFDALKNNNYNF